MSQPKPAKPLTGAELRQIIMKDIGTILDGDGMLATHIAYGRIGYDVTVKLHSSRLVDPTWQNKTTSRKPTVQDSENNPALEALDAFPLSNPEEDAIAAGTTRSREIDSPNAARIFAGLPISAVMREADGEIVEKSIHYTFEEAGIEGNVVDETYVDKHLTPEEVVKK